jgi:putative ABC transport system substrate-binding protein
MQRRALFSGLTAALLPGVAAAETKRRLGVLMGTGEDDVMALAYKAALAKGLAQVGWRDGGNIVVDWRWAGGEAALFDRYAVELLALRPDVVLAQSSPAVRALRRLAGAVPIVFTIVTDPVVQGFVASLAHPGGNVTGFTDYDSAMAGKWVDLLTRITPPVARVAVVYNPATAPFADTMFRAVEAAARSNSVTAEAMPWHDEAGIAATMAALAGTAKANAGGAVVLADIFNVAHRPAIIAAAARHRVPVIYFNRSFPASGGLMSYGVNYVEQYRRAAQYVDRLLKGAKAAELPVQQPDKFDFTVNLATAKAAGIELSPTLIASADDVIE